MAFDNMIFGNVVKMDGGHQRGGRVRKSPTCECMVSLTGNKHKEIVFRFYKGSEKRTFDGLNRGTFGVYNSKVYFRGATDVNGSIAIYAKTNKCNNKELKLRLLKPETAELLKKYVGSYNLEFDNEAGFYYIDANHKLV